MMTVTSGSSYLHSGESTTYSVMIAWSKLPKEVKSICKLTKGQGNIVPLDKDKTMQNIVVSFPNKGEKEEQGVYRITLPNGKSKDIAWMKPISVKE